MECILSLSLKKHIEQIFQFTHIFDLQNSGRTRFYKKFLLSTSVWSSTETILELKNNFRF